MDIEGSVALVTGTTSGIGHALALALAERGASVILAARTLEPSNRRPSSLVETRDEIQAAGGEALAVACDLSEPESIAHLIAEALAWKGHVDLLVNNAAYMGKDTYAPLDALTLKSWNRQFAVNVTASMLLTQGLVPSMRLTGGGVIVNITSRNGELQEGVVPGIVYPTTKAALNRLTIVLARELRADGIAVFALDPGYVRTEIAEKAAEFSNMNIDNAHSIAEPIRVLFELIGRDASEVTSRIWGTVAGQPPVLRHDGRDAASA